MLAVSRPESELADERCSFCHQPADHNNYKPALHEALISFTGSLTSGRLFYFYGCPPTGQKEQSLGLSVCSSSEQLNSGGPVRSSHGARSRAQQLEQVAI